MRWFFLIFLILVASPALARDYYVAVGGNDSNAGTSAAPFQVIDKCALVMVAGDTCHVKPGVYSAGPQHQFCTTPDVSATTFACQTVSGTSGKPITYISDVQWGAKLQCDSTTTDSTFFLIDASYISIIGFDMTCPGSTSTYGWAAAPFGNNGHEVFQRNYIHDISLSACKEVGVLTDSDGGGGPFTNVGHNVYDGNIIRHVGTNISTPVGSIGTQCADQHGIYVTAPFNVITNNIISGIVGLGIHAYGGGICNELIANNITFDNSSGGILLEDLTSNHPDICGTGGAGVTDFNVVINNISANNSYAMGFGTVDNDTPYNGEFAGLNLYGAAVGTHNIVSNNIVFGTNPNNGTVDVDYHVVAPAVVTNPVSGSNSTSFINYLSDKNWAPTSSFNFLNYKIPQWNPGINGGIFVPQSSISIVDPAINHDVLGNFRPSQAVPDIGAFEYYPLNQDEDNIPYRNVNVSAPPGGIIGFTMDTLTAAGTPAVVAYSMNRGLSAAYTGKLFNVIRASDSATTDIGMINHVVDYAAYESFCAATTCYMHTLYDQGPSGLNLVYNGGYDAFQTSALVFERTLGNGKHVFYCEKEPNAGHTSAQRNPVGYSTGTRNGGPNNGGMPGVPVTGSGVPVTEYWVIGNEAVASCCFDFGEAESVYSDTGNGHMFALGLWNIPPFEGTIDVENGGLDGAWITADLNSQVVKTDGQTVYTAKGGNAQTGNMSARTTNGPLSNAGPGYQPMHLEGGIAFMTGGDGAAGGTGIFYEGYIVASQTSDATDTAVQATITGFYGPP